MQIQIYNRVSVNTGKLNINQLYAHLLVFHQVRKMDNSMQLNGERTLLQEYIVTLQKQNQAKNKQRQTLYAQIDTLHQRLKQLQIQVVQKQFQSQHSADVERMRCRIRDLQQEIEILKYEQQHLFQQNLSLISEMEKVTNSQRHLQRENVMLKGQKQELEKFRMAIQRITSSLKDLQAERAQLSQANLFLIEENSYLKGLLSGIAPERLYLQNQPMVKSTYLMSSSFEKISEYQEQEEDSNEGSKRKRHGDEEFQHQNQNKEQNCQNGIIEEGDSSYLMMDERSRESLRVSYEQQAYNLEGLAQNVNNVEHHRNQSVNNNLLIAQDDVIEASNDNYHGDDKELYIESFQRVTGKRESGQLSQRSCNLSKRSVRNNEQSSCDVIQDEPNSSRYLKGEGRSGEKLSEIEGYRRKIEELESRNAQLEGELQEMKEKYCQQRDEKMYLTDELVETQRQFQNSQQEWQAKANQMESDIEQLIDQYNQLVGEAEQVRSDNLSYLKQIEELHATIESMGERQMRANKMGDNLALRQQSATSNSNNRSPVTSSHKRFSQHLSSQSRNQSTPCLIRNSSLSQIDQSVLIRQNNQLIQKINQIQREKNSLYQRGNHSGYQSNKGSEYSVKKKNLGESVLDQSDKENLVDYCNPSYSERRNQNQKQSVNQSLRHEPTYGNGKREHHSGLSNTKSSMLFSNHFNSRMRQTRGQSLFTRRLADSGYEIHETPEIRQVQNRLQRRIERIKCENEMLLKELQGF